MSTRTEGNTDVMTRKESTLKSSNVQAVFHPSPGPIGRVYTDHAGQYYLHTQTSGHLKIDARVGNPLALRQGAADRLVSRLQARLRPYQLATVGLSVTTVILGVLLLTVAA